MGGLGIINLTRQYNTERPTLESYLLKYMYITCVLNELHFFMQEFENKVCWIDRFLLQMSPATENRHSMSTKPADIPRKCSTICWRKYNFCHGPSKNTILQHQSTEFCKTGYAPLFSVHNIHVYRPSLVLSRI